MRLRTSYHPDMSSAVQTVAKTLGVSYRNALIIHHFGIRCHARGLVTGIAIGAVVTSIVWALL